MRCLSIWKTDNCSVPRKQTRVIEECSGILSGEKLQPGERVFINCFKCTTRGRKFTGQGIRNKKIKAKVSNISKSFKGRFIFIDTVTGFDIQFQSFFSAQATIDAVEQFKANVRDNGIIVSEYESYRGSCFTSQESRKHQ